MSVLRLAVQRQEGTRHGVFDGTQSATDDTLGAVCGDSFPLFVRRGVVERSHDILIHSQMDSACLSFERSAFNMRGVPRFIHELEAEGAADVKLLPVFDCNNFPITIRCHTELVKSCRQGRRLCTVVVT